MPKLNICYPCGVEKVSGPYVRMSRKMNVVMGKIENKKTERESRTRSTDDWDARFETEKNPGRALE